VQKRNITISLPRGILKYLIGTDHNTPQNVVDNETAWGGEFNRLPIQIYIKATVEETID